MACRTRAGDSFLSYAPNTTVKGGVLRVIDYATGDIARTTDGWIEDEKYGWYANPSAGNCSAEFDTEVTYNGKKTLKVEATNSSGKISIYLDANKTTTGNLPVASLKKAIPVKPSTAYVFSIPIKSINNQTTSSGFVIYEYTSLGVYIKSTTYLPVPAGDSDFNVYSRSITTNSNAGLVMTRLVGVNIANEVLAKTYFAVDDSKFEEVSTITNPSSTPANLYPKVTAVTSNDNIDQSQTTVSAGGIYFGNAGNFQQIAHNFTATKKNLISVIIQKYTSDGTYVGNVIVSIQATTAGKPNGTIIQSYTIPNATWEGLTNAVDYVVPMIATLTPGTVYSIVLDSSTKDNTNRPNIKANTTTSGMMSYNGSVWSTYGTNALYFKTIYSKNTDNFTVRTDTQTLSVTAPTTDGWEDGTVIDTATLGIAPLVLAPGVNNIYYSSNGPATADGTVDPSMQCIISNQIYNQGRAKATSRSKTTTRSKSVLRDKTC